MSKLINGIMTYNNMYDLISSNDWRESIWMEYLHMYGDKAPSDVVTNETAAKMKAKEYGSYECPECEGKRFFHNPSYSTPVICKTCNGFGYFNHKPEPITQIVGWK